MVRAGSNGPRRGPRDPAWKYCHPLKEGDTTAVVCNYCNKIITAGITRAKEHLMGKKGNVSPCLGCPDDVKEELWTNYHKKLGDEELPPVENIEIKDESEDSNIAAEQEKEPKDRMHQCIARFWYQAGLSFDLMKMKSFEEMVETIGACGKHVDVPTYHDIIVPLVKEMEDKNEQRNEPIMCTRGKREKRKVSSSWGALTASQTSEKQAMMNTSSASEQVEMLNFEDSDGEKCVNPLNESVGMDDQFTVVGPTKPVIKFVYSRKKKGVTEKGQTISI